MAASSGLYQAARAHVSKVLVVTFKIVSPTKEQVFKMSAWAWGAFHIQTTHVIYFPLEEIIATGVGAKVLSPFSLPQEVSVLLECSQCHVNQ